MILVIDVGNTNTVLGLLEGDQIRHTFRISTLVRSTDELGVLLLQLFTHRGVRDVDIDGAICSSVVPSQVYTVEKACRRYLSVETLVVGRDRLKTGMRIRVENPREVGADRIVNAVAARERFGGPVLIVDFGTATTIDCVDASGDYVGGVIAPGFKISEEALFERTAKLPRVEVARPQSAIGKNTIQAMQSGMYFGYVGLVDSLARRCIAELGVSEVTTVATGGLASLLSEDLEMVDEVDPVLTMRGLKLLYDWNT